MCYVIFGVTVLILSAIIIWLVAKVHFLKHSQQNFQDMEQKLKETFQSLSLDVLAKNSDHFLNIAGEKLEGKKELIDKSIEQMSKTLSDVQKKMSDVEKGSSEISSLVKTHSDITTKLKDTTEHLRQAFASSKKRGEWGERMAEDIIRLIGMVEGLNYIKQKTVEESANRPDYTFLLPNKLKINMDVKFPLDNYQHYLDSQTEHDRKRFKEELVKNMKIMIKQVTNRNYIDTADNTVDYVILFIPNEQVFSFINEADITIMDEALKQKVILCSPFTLYAVLAVIRQAVENFNMERTASEIIKLLGEFHKQWENYKKVFTTMGERLDSAKEQYDQLIGTRKNMLEKPLNKIDELRKRQSITFDETINLE
ncbi:MAG: DNA recombination protein RmuC [Nitrospiraceae bacterium]|nr:DNA recombination protein RmuC [Nitrospiraceae bacterium]